MAITDSQDDNTLSSFGYKPELRRTMGSFSSFALAFSMISVTTTVFTLFPQPFQQIGGVAIWLWLPCIAGVLLIAAVYGHLAVRLPLTGYAYHWASRLVNPHFGWFTGWNAMLCTFCGSASIAVALGTVFAPTFWDDPSRANVITLAVGGIVIAVIVNIVSLQLTARVNNIGASAELFGTVGLTLILGIGLAFFSNKQGPGVLFQSGSSTGGAVTITAIATALLLPIWTLAGWEGSADLAEETHDPRKVAPSSMMRAVLISGITGVATFAIFAMAIPGTISDTVNATNKNPMISIFEYHFGSAGGFILQVVAFTGMFSCLLANVTVATRTCFALSRDNLLPFSKALAKISKKTKVPTRAVLLAGTWATGVTFLSSGIAAQVTGIVSVVLYVTYGLSLLSAYLGTKSQRIPAAQAGYFDISKYLSLLCVIGMVWCLVVIGAMVLPSASFPVLRTTVYFELVAILWWALVLRKKLNEGESGPLRSTA
jgi:amino acid transporter